MTKLCRRRRPNQLYKDAFHSQKSDSWGSR